MFRTLDSSLHPGQYPARAPTARAARWKKVQRGEGGEGEMKAEEEEKRSFRCRVSRVALSRPEDRPGKGWLRADKRGMAPAVGGAREGEKETP